MTKYRVHLVAVASTQVEVEADDPDEAIDAALSSDSLPYASAFAGFELEDWTLASELWPSRESSYDWEEVE